MHKSLTFIQLLDKIGRNKILKKLIEINILFIEDVLPKILGAEYPIHI